MISILCLLPFVCYLEMGLDKIRVMLRGPNQNSSSYEPLVLAVLCSCSPQTPSAWALQGVGKDKLRFFLAHFACKCNFPSCSSLKLLFPGLAFVYFSHAAQVSLISAFIPLFSMGCIPSSAFIPSPLPVLSLQACCFSHLSPGGKMWSEPLQMGEEAAPASVSSLLQSSDESFDRRGQEEQKSLSALAGSVGARQDEMRTSLSLFSCVAEELQAPPSLIQLWRAMLPCRCCFVPPFAPGEIGSVSSDESLNCSLCCGWCFPGSCLEQTGDLRGAAGGFRKWQWLPSAVVMPTTALSPVSRVDWVIQTPWCFGRSSSAPALGEQSRIFSSKHGELCEQWVIPSPEIGSHGCLQVSSFTPVCWYWVRPAEQEFAGKGLSNPISNYFSYYKVNTDSCPCSSSLSLGTE